MANWLILPITNSPGGTNPPWHKFRSIGDYPQITILSFLYERIHIYGTWESGRGTSLRRAKPADARCDVLEENCSNLGLFLNQTLGTAPAYKREVVEGMKYLYPRFDNYEVVINGGAVQIFFTEGDTSIPAPGCPTARCVTCACWRYSTIVQFASEAQRREVFAFLKGCFRESP